MPTILLALGLYLMPIRIFQPDFSKIPGDFGDARFNNYILEHGHLFITGKVDKYWDAPFMYPYPNVIAFSDNLLGTVPIYSTFRLLGKDRETAFQLWLLTLFVLNFICCYWVLFKWSNNLILSSVGAYIFAFSIFNLGHIYNVQNFPRFIVPFVFFWAWKYFTQKNLKYFLFTILGIVFQFYCGIYLGFFLVYTLLFLFIAYVVVYRDIKLFTQFKEIKKIAYHILILVFAAFVLAPLIMPYLEISRKFGMRHFEEIIATIPTLRSYFFTSKAPIMWQVLTEHGKVLPLWWCHFLYMGIMPWLGIISVPLLLVSRKIESDKKKFIAFIFLGLFLSFIFCLNINGFTLYKFIFELPGFSSMRSINRVINTEVMFFILIFVFVFNEFVKTSRIAKWIVISFPVLIIMDNLIDPQEVMRYDKHESQNQIRRVEANIQKQYDKKCNAIAYVTDEIKTDPVRVHLNVMLAAQELNTPCVNAYSGACPPEFNNFFSNGDDKSLTEWLKYNLFEKNRIQEIKDLLENEESRQQVQIKAMNNKYVCADRTLNNLLIANRDNAGEWESFTLINLKNNKCSIRASDNNFLSADINHQNEIIASKKSISKLEEFTITKFENNIVSFKACNGKYLSYEEKSEQIFATANYIGAKEKFILKPQ